MTRRHNLAAAAASFAVALGALATAVATPASAQDPSRGMGGTEGGGMHEIMGGMEIGGGSHEAMHTEMHALCHRMMGGHRGGDEGGGDGR